MERGVCGGPDDGGGEVNDEAPNEAPNECGREGEAKDDAMPERSSLSGRAVARGGMGMGCGLLVAVPASVPAAAAAPPMVAAKMFPAAEAVEDEVDVGPRAAGDAWLPTRGLHGEVGPTSNCKG